MVRLRLQFSKTGPIRYTSHLDTMRIFQRCFKACDLPVKYSQGFHPHIKMSFGPSLKTGWEGLNEYLDLYLDESTLDVEKRCNRYLPEGISITGSVLVSNELAKLSVEIIAARFESQVTRAGRGLVGESSPPTEVNGRSNHNYGKGDGISMFMDPLAPFREKSTVCKEGAKAIKSGSTPELLDLALSENDHVVTIDYMTTMNAGKCIPPEEVVRSIFGRAEVIPSVVKIVRTGLFVKRKGVFVSPLEQGE